MRFGFIVGLVLVAVSVLASGCNTMRGAGRDIQRLGEKIQESVR